MIGKELVNSIIKIYKKEILLYPETTDKEGDADITDLIVGYDNFIAKNMPGTDFEKIE